MEKLIGETLQIAKEKFSAFGFTDPQINKLLESGRNDLEKEITKLTILIENRDPDIKQINQSLHALKGLLYNMGNTVAGDIMNDLKNDTDTPERISKILQVIKS